MTAAMTGYATCLPQDRPRTEIPTTDDWFDVKERLGRRGYRALPLPAQLTLAAVRDLHRSTSEAEHDDTRGLWLGSATAASHCLDVLDTGILRDGTEMIPPTGAPYFSVNLVPARAVNEIGSTGPAVTVTTAGTAGLDAVLCAVRAVHLGRVADATVVLVEVPGPSVHEMSVIECGAVALRLARDGAGPHLAGTSRFVPEDPSRAAHQVIDALSSRRAARVVVFGDHPVDGFGRTVELVEGGALAAATTLLEAARDGQDIVVVLVDALGGATGVVLTGRPSQEVGT